mmetsp:Transcript_110098/g.316835  ORF Transcript_110098/g.316835 Transcript_110098/m.316835 type:complete len:238 (-) Transcript_110098:1055-1768(-)
MRSNAPVVKLRSNWRCKARAATKHERQKRIIRDEAPDLDPASSQIRKPNYPFEPPLGTLAKVRHRARAARGTSMPANALADWTHTPFFRAKRPSMVVPVVLDQPVLIRHSHVAMVVAQKHKPKSGGADEEGDKAECRGLQVGRADLQDGGSQLGQGHEQIHTGPYGKEHALKVVRDIHLVRDRGANQCGQGREHVQHHRFGPSHIRLRDEHDIISNLLRELVSDATGGHGPHHGGAA